MTARASAQLVVGERSSAHPPPRAATTAAPAAQSHRGADGLRGIGVREVGAVVAAAGLGARQRGRGDGAGASGSARRPRSRCAARQRAVGRAVEQLGQRPQPSPRRAPPTRARVMARCSSARANAGRTGGPSSAVATGPRSAACRGGRAPARPPTTRPSSRLLDASRLAPCSPVRATSPAANRPGTFGAAVHVGDDAAAAVVRAGHHRDRLRAAGRCPRPGTPR